MNISGNIRTSSETETVFEDKYPKIQKRNEININSDNEVSLPPEMYEEIFSYMTGPELTKCSHVSKE